MEKRQKPRPYLATPRSCEITSVDFAHAARQLSDSARSLGLVPPAFRSPPRKPGLTRSIVRRPDGSATVAVALRGRPAGAVLADMVDGIVAANNCAAAVAPGIRDQLWASSERALAQAFIAEGVVADHHGNHGQGEQRRSGGNSRRPTLRALDERMVGGADLNKRAA